MQGELRTIRAEIMRAVGNTGLPPLFISPADLDNCHACPSEWAARSRGVDDGSVSWQSLMYMRGSIQIYLKYMRSSVARDARRIRVAGGDFAVKICIFDEDNAHQIPRETLFGRMKDLGMIPAALPQNWARHILNGVTRKVNVGAVLELYATGGGVWNINEGASDRGSFVNSVAAAIGYLLPIAARYIQNRRQLFNLQNWIR